MGTYSLLADALQYPAAGHLESLQTGLMELPAGEVKRALSEFVQRMQALSLAEREELHTRTLDLTPIVAPYVGFQIWGKNYQRGKFMAELNRALEASGIDPEGELPDHLIPVLRYLDTSSDPLPELMEAGKPAVRAMRNALQKSEPDNPYGHLLSAILQAL